MTLAVLTLGVAGTTAMSAHADDAALNANDLFTNDIGNDLTNGWDFVEFHTPLGDIETKTITLTATRDLTLSTQGEMNRPGSGSAVTGQRSGTCPPYFGSVAMKAGQSCTITFVYTATLSNMSYFAGQNFRATIAGQNVDFSVGVNAMSTTMTINTPIDFGTVKQSSTGTQQVTVTNVTRFPITLNDVASQQIPWDMLLALESCPTIDAYASCTMDLAWTPTYDNPAMSNYFYLTGTIDGGQKAMSNSSSLKGVAKGLVTSLSVTPSLDFGSLDPDTASTLDISFTNDGETDMVLNSWALYFSDSRFSTPTELPLTIPSGTTATLPVTFAGSPDSGPVSSSLSISAYTADYSGYAGLSVSLAANVNELAPVDPTDPTTQDPTPTDPTTPPVVPTPPVAPPTPVTPVTPPVEPVAPQPEPTTVTQEPELTPDPAIARQEASSVPTAASDESASDAAPASIAKKSADAASTAELASTGSQSSSLLPWALALTMTGLIALFALRRRA